MGAPVAHARDGKPAFAVSGEKTHVGTLTADPTSAPAASAAAGDGRGCGTLQQTVGGGPICTAGRGGGSGGAGGGGSWGDAGGGGGGDGGGAGGPLVAGRAAAAWGLRQADNMHSGCSARKG